MAGLSFGKSKIKKRTFREK